MTIADEIVIRIPNTAEHRDVLKDLAVFALDRKYGAQGAAWRRVAEQIDVAVQPEQLDDELPLDALEER